MKFGLISAATIWLAAVFQQALPDRIALFGARPDFLLIAVLCLGLLVPAPGSMVVGFVGGVVQGAIVGANLAQYAVTRMIASYVASRVSELEIEISVPIAALCVLLGTLFAQILLMFMAPPRSLGGFIGDTIASAIYNAVIAVPFYAALRPLLKKDRA